ncbi:hypothetical protein GUJ93_ZPchr0013g36128 [Zizania palustris]|uniref:Plastocyanin-like domain-containing protein n=1 Tax=Zizania palustris TaxID=103762 RepID=A0A8J5WV26_ZIZPA|nr:hypothetical protein GUJ93_ZPchr0013g36128 [Zizania palustris]
MRSTLYGHIIILPKSGVPFPFAVAKPHRDVPIIFDPETTITQAMQTGGGPNISDAYTINSLPGPPYNCSSRALHLLCFEVLWALKCVLDGLADTFRLKVRAGETYLLRLIDAALNDELFFSVANHTLTPVVDVDAAYVMPFDTDVVLITPGQTTNVLLRAKTDEGYPPSHLMLARPYATGLRNLRQHHCHDRPQVLLDGVLLRQLVGVYTADFPAVPPEPFNYTGTPPNNTNVSNGTKVVVRTGPRWWCSCTTRASRNFLAAIVVDLTAKLPTTSLCYSEPLPLLLRDGIAEEALPFEKY